MCGGIGVYAGGIALGFEWGRFGVEFADAGGCVGDGVFPDGIVWVLDGCANMDVFPVKCGGGDRRGVFPGVDGPYAHGVGFTHSGFGGGDGDEAVGWACGYGEARGIGEANPLVVVVGVEEQKKVTVGCGKGGRLPVGEGDGNGVFFREGALGNAQVDVVMPRVEIATPFVLGLDVAVFGRLGGEVIGRSGIVLLQVGPVEGPAPGYAQSGVAR